MDTIEDRMKECERWEQAEENLKSFKETMKLVKQYPIKHNMKRVPPPHWDLTTDLLGVGIGEYGNAPLVCKVFREYLGHGRYHIRISFG